MLFKRTYLGYTAFLLFLLSPALHGQSSIVGTVTDPAGGVVPSAAVHVTNEQTSQVREEFSWVLDRIGQSKADATVGPLGSVGVLINDGPQAGFGIQRISRGGGERVDIAAIRRDRRIAVVSRNGG